MSRPHGSTDRKLQLPPEPSILLVRHDRIGDVLISTPTINLLRERFPQARITLLLGKKNRAMARMVPGIDDTILLPDSRLGTLQTMRRVRKERYDLSIHLLARDSATGALLMAMAGAASRIGFSGEPEDFYDHPVIRDDRLRHIVSTTSLLLAPLGIEPIGAAPRREGEHLQVVVPPESMKNAIANMPSLFKGGSRVKIILNISGSGPEKFWGVKNFVELSRHLQALGYEPFIATSPAERALGERIASDSESRLLPAGNLEEFVAMLSAADLILSPDTSIVHFGAALRKPVVELVASDLVATEWAPWGTSHCIVRHDDGIGMISIDDVIPAIQGLIPATTGRHNTSSRA